MNLKKYLESVGIKCRYSKAEDDMDVLLLSLSGSREAVLIQGSNNAKIKAYKSSKHRQVVLNVHEPERSFIQSIKVYTDKGEITKKLHKKDLSLLASYAKMKVILASEDQEVVIKRVIDRQESGMYEIFELEIEISATETNNSFLIGYDETHLFISMLPEQATSVAHAHEILRPDGISDAAIRVGEWFFDPISDSKLEKLHRHQYGVDVDSEWSMEDTDSGNHQASLILYRDKDVYVAGCIYDERNTHKTVQLPGICKVYRNREIINESESWD